MRSTIAAVLFVLSLLGVASRASAGVEINIDLSNQSMAVYVDGVHRHSWRVSTARSGYVTPTGSYRPYLLKPMHYSRKYDNSPMPHSIFFRGGYAIHGTGYVNQLGRPASHGCIRLAPGNAARLYSLVSRYGKGNTSIDISY